jgi:CheY-like chemotaxis protein/Tfp pilus assembly protein PilZ
MALNDVKAHTASRRRFMLVVDSDDASRSYTSELLGKFQYAVCTAKTGQEALEIAGVITPVLVIIARELDDMSGLDVLRNLKQLTTAQPVAFIMLYRDDDPAQDRACLAAGAAVCLPVPVSIEDLYRVVQMAVEPVPRMNLRIRTELPVSIDNHAVECDGGGCGRMLSEHGIYIRTSRAYPLRTRLLLRIHLAGDDLSVEAEVVYARDAGDGRRHPGIGLQFTRISRQDQMRIRKYIRDEIAKGMRRRGPASQEIVPH